MRPFVLTLTALTLAGAPSTAKAQLDPWYRVDQPGERPSRVMDPNSLWQGGWGLALGGRIDADFEVGAASVHSFRAADTGRLLGHMALLWDLSEPERGVELWDWAAGWPDEDFTLEVGESLPNPDTSVVYGNLTFEHGVVAARAPAAQRTAQVYEVSTCEADLACETAAWLRVDLETGRLDWFALDHVDRRIVVPDGGFLHFAVQDDAPPPVEGLRAIRQAPL